MAEDFSNVPTAILATETRKRASDVFGVNERVYKWALLAFIFVAITTFALLFTSNSLLIGSSLILCAVAIGGWIRACWLCRLYCKELNQRTKELNRRKTL